MTEPTEKDFVKKQPYAWIVAVIVTAIVFFAGGYFVHTPSTTPAPSNGGTGNVTITFYESLASNEASNFTNVLIPQFEAAHSNISVVFANLPSGGVATEFQALVQSGNVGPTIGGLDNLLVGNVLYSQQGNLLMNLTNISSTMMPSTLMPAAVNMTNYEKNVLGGVYFLPFRSNIPLVFYNKTAFNTAGISAPPANNTQLLADAQTLASHGFTNPIMVQGAGTSIDNGADTSTELYQFMVQYGGNPFVLNSTADIQAWDFLYNLSDHFDPGYTGGYWGSYAGLAQNGGYKILDYQWPYVYNLLTNTTYKMNSSTLGVYAGPAGPVNSNHLLGGDVLVIPKGATNLWALESFANFLLSPQAQKETLVNLSWVPVNSEAYNDLPSSTSAVGAALQQAISTGIFLRNPTPWIGQWNVYASEAWNDIIISHVSSISAIPGILSTYNHDMYTYLVNNYGQSVATEFENGGYAPISV